MESEQMYVIKSTELKKYRLENCSCLWLCNSLSRPKHNNIKGVNEFFKRETFFSPQASKLLSTGDLILLFTILNRGGEYILSLVNVRKRDEFAEVASYRYFGGEGYDFRASFKEKTQKPKSYRQIAQEWLMGKR